jgi:hypothetical protein
MPEAELILANQRYGINSKSGDITKIYTEIIEFYKFDIKTRYIRAK